MRYDVIYYSFPINSQYLMTWGVDNPDFQTSKFVVFKYYMFWFYLDQQMSSIKFNIIITKIMFWFVTLWDTAPLLQINLDLYSKHLNLINPILQS